MKFINKMKKAIIYHLTFYLLLTAFVTQAQDKRTLSTKVADLLAQMPADDLSHRDRLMREMLDLGEEGFRMVSNNLVPAGKGDDTAVRFALNSLARYASAFGREQDRAQVENQLIGALAQADDTEVKTFLMNQLTLVGQAPAVQAACQYLQDNAMCEPATQVLLAVGGQEAAEALAGALPDAAGATQVTMVKALGELNSEAAASQIEQLLPAEDPALQKAALMALAHIGAPSSYSKLWSEANKAGFTYDPANAAGAFLTYTDRLGEKGALKESKKACLAMAKASREPHQLHNNTAALAIYTRHFGFEALDELLEAVDHPDKKYRNTILQIAQPVGGVAATRQWIAKAGEADAAITADIVAMLGRRGDESAISFLKKSMNSPSSEVRQEAITALATLQGTATVPLLLSRLVEGKEVDHTKNTLLYLLDEPHLDPVAGAMEQAKGPSLAALIEVVAAKSGKRFFNVVYDYTSSADTSVQHAALAALEHTATQEEVPRLLKLLLDVNSPKAISAVQNAVVAGLSAVESEDARTSEVLAALEASAQKERLLEILPHLGGAKALETVYGYYTREKGALKASAFQTLVNWKDYAASEKLYLIARNTSGKERDEALAGYVRQIAGADLPEDQKVLAFRKVMPYARSAEEKRQILGALAKVPTFLSLMYVSGFLNEPAVEQEAARAAMNIALPASGNTLELYGDTVRSILQKVASVLSGEESEYMKENIRHYLDDMPKGKGFVSMFNGKDLSGWQGFVADPISKAKMSEQELARRQKEADQKLGDNWQVKDGMIVFSGKGENLCSVKEYGDFEMLVDWRITRFGDSGIYLRGTPQVQIWDTARVEVGAQVGSGGLYNNKQHPSKPLKVADNAVGEWNTFRILMEGDQVTVHLNGELVTDKVVLENYWDRSLPIFEKGPIELQAHGTDLAFRNIYVREISEEDFQLMPEEKADGFVSLFNGKNLDGWTGNTTDYLVEDGILVIRPEQGGHGNLYTEKEYSDFNFRFEFQLTPGANNGLGIRAPLGGDAAYGGMELQILDNTAAIYKDLHEYQYHGSVYGVIPAERGYLKPVGEWNEQEVIVKGSRVKVILNGHTILDGDIREASKNGTPDGKDHPGLQREKGHIGFLGHGSVVKFRNIRIKELRDQ